MAPRPGRLEGATIHRRAPGLVNQSDPNPESTIQMSKKNFGKNLPDYRGKKWLRSGLPKKAKSWMDDQSRAAETEKDVPDRQAIAGTLQETLRHGSWKWPRHPIFFVADPHADADAFVASLVASGGVKKTGAANHKFNLTKIGCRSRFIIGGDCLDKGPNNLALLRSVRALMDTGAKVDLLAGNHDLRLLLGLRVLGTKRDPRTEHFFLRMGPKVVPLLKEVFDEYLRDDKNALDHIPNEATCRRKLYPSKRWFREFPKVAEWMMSSYAVNRELSRMRHKVDLFAHRCEKAGLNMRTAYAAAKKCKELFLDHQGEFGWFFEQMQLARREGSLLFIHAGFDDRIAALVADKGVAYLNALFRQQIHDDLFEFYYGPVANTLRTKYRKVDMPLTRHGVKKMHKIGIHALVHGHRNVIGGQRIMIRRGMLHFESDTTMDRNSRRKEGLEGYGIGATIIRPEGEILGISNDAPYAKVFRLGDLEYSAT